MSSVVSFQIHLPRAQDEMVCFISNSYGANARQDEIREFGGCREMARVLRQPGDTKLHRNRKLETCAERSIAANI